jgi:hypothetical protein
MTRTVAWSELLLQVVADYERVSAVQGAAHAGHGRASGLQFPGVRTRAAWLHQLGA